MSPIQLAFLIFIAYMISFFSLTPCSSHDLSNWSDLLTSSAQRFKHFQVFLIFQNLSEMSCLNMLRLKKMSDVNLVIFTLVM
jgi:hypothetical protein